MIAKFDIVKGDITTAFNPIHGCNVIVHGCNCLGIMGAGVAHALTQKWPEVSRQDIRGYMHGDDTIDCEYLLTGDRKRLGNYTIAGVDQDGHSVVNLYTQYAPARKRGDVVIDWEACERGLGHVFRDASLENGLRLALPEIGCGLAGGEVEDFYTILDRVMTKYPDVKVTIFRL